MAERYELDPNMMRGKEDVIALTRGILGAFAKVAKTEPGSRISWNAINQNLLMKIEARLVKDKHIDDSAAAEAVWKHTEGNMPPTDVWMGNSFNTVERAMGREIYIQKAMKAADRLKKEFANNARYGEALDYLKRGLTTAHDKAVTLRGMNDTIRLYEIQFVVEAHRENAPATP